MSEYFGAQTDHFGLADTNLIVVESSENPFEQSRADALDEYGDIVDYKFYGDAGGDFTDASVTYLLKSGTLDLSTLFIGEIATGKAIESLSVETSNGDWPKLSVSGKLGMAAFQVPVGKTAKAKLPAVTIIGGKIAQKMLFDYDSSNVKLTSCSLSASAAIAQADDGEGEPVAFGASFETAEVSAEFVRISDTAPTWAPATGTDVKKNPGIDEPQAGFHTATASLEVMLSREDA